MATNTYLILLDNFLNTVKNSDNAKYPNEAEIASKLFRIDSSSLSKYKKVTSLYDKTRYSKREGEMKPKKLSPLPPDDFAEAMISYFTAYGYPDIIKSKLTSFLHTVGDCIKEEIPKNSMYYFVYLINEDGSSYYNEEEGYIKAIRELTKMLYRASYYGENFYELQARRDRYRIFFKEDNHYNETIKFLLSREPLPESVKEYFRAVDGEPAQSIIYNTLIYTMGAIFDEEMLIKKTAEIYHYQTLLNYKIGRISSKKDYYLLKCILREIKYRHLSNPLPALAFDLNDSAHQPDLKSEEYQEFVEKVFDYYTNTFLKNDTSFVLSQMSSNEIISLIESYNATHTNSNVENLLLFLKDFENQA